MTYGGRLALIGRRWAISILIRDGRYHYAIGEDWKILLRNKGRLEDTIMQEGCSYGDGFCKLFLLNGNFT